MRIRNLEHRFQPGSVAVIVASERPQSPGAPLMRNLLEAGFAGPIWPVVPKHPSVAGRLAMRDAASLQQPPGLAVICTPAPTVPALSDILGHKGTRAAARNKPVLLVKAGRAPGGATAAASHTRVPRLLAGYRDRVAIDHEALHLALLKVSQLICDCPEVLELAINPLRAENRGVIALDARVNRVKVVPARSAGAQRLAVRPYPGELEERIDCCSRWNCSRTNHRLNRLVQLMDLA